MTGFVIRSCCPSPERVASKGPNGRSKVSTYDGLGARDKADLDIAWARDPAQDDRDSLLAPEVVAQEIVHILRTALSDFAAGAEME